MPIHSSEYDEDTDRRITKWKGAACNSIVGGHGYFMSRGGDCISPRGSRPLAPESTLVRHKLSVETTNPFKIAMKAQTWKDRRRTQALT